MAITGENRVYTDSLLLSRPSAKLFFRRTRVTIPSPSPSVNLSENLFLRAFGGGEADLFPFSQPHHPPCAISCRPLSFATGPGAERAFSFSQLLSEAAQPSCPRRATAHGGQPPRRPSQFLLDLAQTLGKLGIGQRHGQFTPRPLHGAARLVGSAAKTSRHCVGKIEDHDTVVDVFHER